MLTVTRRAFVLEIRASSVPASPNETEWPCVNAHMFQVPNAIGMSGTTVLVLNRGSCSVSDAPVRRAPIVRATNQFPVS